MVINKLSVYLINIAAFIIGINLSYEIIKLTILVIFYKFGLNNNLVEYLTLTLTLTVFSYFPDKFTFWFQHIINKLIIKMYLNDITMRCKEETEKLEKFMIILNPKVWIYLISIVFTLLNSLEKISGTSLIEIKAWLEIKPIIFESVFTMLVIDRFVKQVKSDKDKTKKNIEDYKN